MTARLRVAAVVLAAGRGVRFGGAKLLAPLDGLPLLQHVLDAAAAAGLGDVVVVLGDAADELERAISWRAESRVRNAAPERGISSSLQVGLGALRPDIDAALILLGDQPRVRAEVIGRLIDAAGVAERASDRPIVVPRYSGSQGPNPALFLREAWPLVDTLKGDRGMGPLIAARPELVREVPVAGDNPDVDTPADLERLMPPPFDVLHPSVADVLGAWATRVRENAEQVERFREVPDPPDFYAPVSGLFRADPRRDDEPTLDQLRALARAEDTWLDIGAGAGRYALPLALRVREVIAIEPSAGMAQALREGMIEHAVTNIRVIEGGWPPDDPTTGAPILDAPTGDVALIAHLGYDIERVGPFLNAMEAAATRLCVAILMERQPSSIADPFWPIVHGEERVPLPALREFVTVLLARDRTCEVRLSVRQPRAFESEEQLAGFLRRQLWVAEDGEKDRRFRAALHERIVEHEGRVLLRDQRPLPIGLVSWQPG